MSPRTQSILLLVMTLVIGIFLGLFLGGRLHHKRMSEMRMFDRPGMLKGFLLDRLQLDAAQREELDSLLEVHSRETSSLIRGHRELMKTRMDSLLQVLRESLGPEEFERLQKAFGEGRRGRPRGPGVPGGPGRHRGPGGPGDPDAPPPGGERLHHADPDSSSSGREGARP